MTGWSGKTQVYGIFGDPVAHSLSPAMHNAAFAALGLDAVYVPFHVLPEGLPAAIAGLRALRIAGINLTVPHKEAVLPLLDEVDPLARQIGAVNTLVVRDRRLVGYNTDGLGFLQSLQQDLQLAPAGRSVLVLGAGGAARAAVFSLAGQGAQRLVIANRTRARAQQLATSVRAWVTGIHVEAVTLEDDLSRIASGCDLVVNTISAGLKDEGFQLLDWSKITASVKLFDMLYSANVMPMVRVARETGHQATDGLGMLAGQGEEAFRLWTGQPPPPGLMHDILVSRRLG